MAKANNPKYNLSYKFKPQICTNCELFKAMTTSVYCTCEMFSNPMAYHDRNCQYQGKQFATKFWLHIGKIFINLKN